MERDRRPPPETSQPNTIRESDAASITSDMVENANAAGDGAIKRSEEPIENKNEQDPAGSTKSY